MDFPNKLAEQSVKLGWVSGSVHSLKLLCDFVWRDAVMCGSFLTMELSCRGGAQQNSGQVERLGSFRLIFHHLKNQNHFEKYTVCSII